MFGSGYNPYRSNALREQEKSLAEAAWGRNLFPLPEGVNPEELYEKGELNQALYSSLMEKSGAADKLLSLRKEAAINITKLQRKESILGFTTLDGRRRKREYKDKFFVLRDLSLQDAEMVVLKKAQNQKMKDFWKELYENIESLTGIRLSLY